MKDVLKPNGLGLKRVFKATYCSYLGFKAAFKEEAAFRQELLLSLILFPTSFWLASSLLHWAILISSLLIILIVELLNSAIEALTDRVSTELHVLSGRAKDMGSAAVTLSLTIVLIIWGVSLYMKIV
ncbi:diacylglycerol kinase [Pseudoalteromonas sp. NZS127_1]|jgi:diacylglycerol kinase (ATP)|uniref:Diacylglycerol kinase n=2 Tax=Pseudoalteromonas arctica TaxID=394751 RepID=A0A290RXI3_9GAMM|nr:MULTISPECIES: diacylglycerol kinase [Pseudoalteromonas]ATC85066.1 diacylglycerol kinase (ATP dependent) [Pseudoalteromonas arctica A 37-1-2]MBG9997313.1 diacylglycerol kinase [Pseudoalteromonas sp. NZS127_1]MBH0001115.1 diacylglycerol kinase [Pseudoalteromonas sp. NSLLW24]MBH0005006.1 diacylglycerol kinase [Pseudoalteromonas sp. SWYJZ12]MBH0014412.1 diacylglycerol kinase [Pseudoalteromonas sp. NZS100_1]